MAKRLFVAVPLPANIVSELRGLIGEFRRVAPPVRWVRPEQMHITLKFLGDIEDVREQPLVDALARVQAEPFRLSLAGVGAFPGKNRPRVVWTGIAAGKDDVTRLAEQVEDLLQQAGFPASDRRFSPHVTLGRVKVAGEFGRFWSAVEAKPYSGTEIDVRDFRLIHSRLTPTGPLYADLASFPLRRVDEKS